MGKAADGWIKLATQMIKQYGRAELTLIVRSNLNVYDEEQLTYTDATPPTVFYELCAPVDYVGKVEEAGKNTLNSYKQMYMPGGTDYVPQIGDIVNLTEVYTIVKILNVFETESIECAYLVQLGV